MKFTAAATLAVSASALNLRSTDPAAHADTEINDSFMFLRSMLDQEPTYDEESGCTYLVDQGRYNGNPYIVAKSLDCGTVDVTFDIVNELADAFIEQTGEKPDFCSDNYGNGMQGCFWTLEYGEEFGVIYDGSAIPADADEVMTDALVSAWPWDPDYWMRKIENYATKQTCEYILEEFYSNEMDQYRTGIKNINCSESITVNIEMAIEDFDGIVEESTYYDWDSCTDGETTRTCSLTLEAGAYKAILGRAGGAGIVSSSITINTQP